MSPADAIKAWVENYYESLMASDLEGVRSVFHENARITGHLPDGLHQMTVEEFAGFVDSKQPSPDASGASGCSRSRERGRSTTNCSTSRVDRIIGQLG